LAARLERLGRIEWAREENSRLAQNAVPEETSNERWRKLRGIGSLDRRKLAVVRALFQWREEVAARTNRPSRTIVRDDLIVEIARRNPTRERDLQVVRGLPKRDLEAIVQTVAAARELPAAECPEPLDRDQDPTQVGLVTNVLTAVLGDLCARNRLATNLVASTADVKMLVRARLAGEGLPERSILTRGWRAKHILPVLRDILEGRRLLRVVDVAADAPFAFEDAAAT
jgi:ribonuclease D